MFAVQACLLNFFSPKPKTKILRNQNIQIILNILKYQKMSEEDKIICLEDYKRKFKKNVSKNVWISFSGAADDKFTFKNNLRSFSLISFIPRVLRNISQVDMKTQILGTVQNIPFGISPVALQKKIHPEGEKLLAKESFLQNTAFGLSIVSSYGHEQITKVNGSGLKIQQMDIFKNDIHNEVFIKMVEQYGFCALAISVDYRAVTKSREQMRQPSSGNLEFPIFNELIRRIKDKTGEQEVKVERNHEFSLEDVKKIRSMTKLKLILKGILNSDQAIVANEIGIDGIWVSNHGGKQLDTAPATIEVLPTIKQTLRRVNSRMELYVDGGIRKGTDIVKCLALGADFVFMGRGMIYSLVDGEQGVHHSFEILKHELEVAMKLLGFSSIKQIQKDQLVVPLSFSRL